jgi:hypothetical protein
MSEFRRGFWCGVAFQAVVGLIWVWFANTGRLRDVILAVLEAGK